MTPDISEFSYGFALTNELMDGFGPYLQAAPIFPSLIDEGRVKGGYDVHLDLPGVPVYLQFKRSDFLRWKRPDCKEAKSSIKAPFFRFHLMRRTHSAQHDLLLDLDAGPNAVYYSAPRFHTTVELNDAFATKDVVNRSFFVRPKTIGSLDTKPHHVAFNHSQAVLCSDPTSLPFLSGSGFVEEIEKRLKKEDRPLRDTLRASESRLMDAAGRHGLVCRSSTRQLRICQLTKGCSGGSPT